MNELTSLDKRVNTSPPLRKSSIKYNFPSVWKAAEVKTNKYKNINWSAQWLLNSLQNILMKYTEKDKKSFSDHQQT